MRTVGRVGIALLLAFALSTPVSAQTFDRISLTASVGPSFATLGTTCSTTAAIDYRVTDRATLVGEFGFRTRRSARPRGSRRPLPRYRLNDWVGLTADYRTFFVHRENDTPRVNWFTTGLAFSLR